MSHGGSLVFINNIDSDVGSFANVLSYVVGCLILAVFTVNFVAACVPLLSHERKKANSMIFSFLAGALGLIVYAMLAAEKRITIASLVCVAPVFLLLCALIWWKEALDVIISKVCMHNDGDNDKMLMEIEMRFDRAGWAFADWLARKNNAESGVDRDLQPFWGSFHNAGYDRLEVVRGISAEELMHEVDLDHKEAEDLHHAFKVLKTRSTFRAAAMLKERHDAQLTKSRAVFTAVAGQLWQGASSKLLRLMLQYAVSVQYYKAVKIHLLSFIRGHPSCSASAKAVSTFGKEAKRKLAAWFRVMKNHPGRVIDLSRSWKNALQTLNTGRDDAAHQKRTFELQWVSMFHKRLLAEMLKANMNGTSNVRNIDVHEEESNAYMRVSISQEWPRWLQQKGQPPALNVDDSDSDSDDEGAGEELKIYYQMADPAGGSKNVPSAVQNLEQVLDLASSGEIVDSTLVFSSNEVFTAIYDGVWTPWGECRYLFASSDVDADADAEAFDNPLDTSTSTNTFEAEPSSTAKSGKRGGGGSDLGGGSEIISKEELLSFEEFRQVRAVFSPSFLIST